MPIYEFECLKCGEVFEILQKRSDPPPKKHECGSRRVRKVMSRSSFILKGTGWYLTDYARKGKTDGEGSESSSGKSSKKADEKADKKADSSTKSESSKSSSKDSSNSGGSGESRSSAA